MKRLFLFLLKLLAFSFGFFLVWLLVGEYTLWALGKVTLIPLKVFGYQPTGMEVDAKAIHFFSALPGRSRVCDVELTPVGVIVFLSLAFATAPVPVWRRLKATLLGLALLLCFHVAYLSVRVLLFSPSATSQMLLVRFFAPAGILLPVVLWILLFPTGLFGFGKIPATQFRRNVCPVCGTRKDDVVTHIIQAHGRGKKGLKSRAARRYLELYGDAAPKRPGKG
ncbi:MAG: hypothetical protein JW952_03760 [Candidatus Eisenbacteria bacterium]|nr:hypothetical protein [Candidatus Eisenbacteria bacterium]